MISKNAKSNLWQLFRFIVVQQPIYVAAQMGNLECIKELVKAGCDHTTHLCGAQPFQIAVNMDKVEVLDYLSELDGFDVDFEIVGTGTSALSLATQFGNIRMIDRLLAKGADINKKNENTGTTALMIGARMGSKEVVKHLLKAGADKEAFDKEKRQAADYAKMALKAGGLPDAKRIIKILSGAGEGGEKEKQAKKGTKKKKAKKTAEKDTTTTNTISVEEVTNKVAEVTVDNLELKPKGTKNIARMSWTEKTIQIFLFLPNDYENKAGGAGSRENRILLK